MRWHLEVVDREAPVRGPVQVVTEDGRVPQGRLLATAAIEFFDQRDRQFWPFVRIPPVLVFPADLAALLAGLRDVVDGRSPGFAWRPGQEESLGVQVGSEGGQATCEVGFDLAGFLSDVAGQPRRTGRELGLFRFPTTQAALVKFASDLRAELEAQGIE